MTKKRALVFTVKLLVTAGLLFFIYRRLPLAELAGTLASVRPLPVVLFMTLLFVNTAISALRWKWFLKADGVHLTFWRLLTSYMIGTFFNMFLPSTIGGDAYRIAAESKSDGLAKSFSSVFADRLSGFVALTSLGLASALIGIRLIQPPGLIWIPALLCFGFLVLALFAVNRAWTEALFKLTRLDKVSMLWRPVSKCLGSFDAYRKTPGLFSRIMALSFLFQIFLILCIWLLAQALAIPAPISLFFIFVPLVSILEAVPVSVYGVGLRDAGYLLLFTQAGLSCASAQVAASSLSLLYLSCTVIYASLGGLLFLGRRFSGQAASSEKK